MQSAIRLQCKSCGGNLTIDPQREVLICPFCGSEELITQELLRLSLPLSAAEGASAASRQLATFTTYYMGLCF